MNDFTGRIRPDEWQPPVGLKRTLTVALDPAQYQADMTHMAAHRSEDVYSTFNLLMRRKPKVTLQCCISHACIAVLRAWFSWLNLQSAFEPVFLCGPAQRLQHIHG